MKNLQEGSGLDRNGFIVSDVSLEKIKYDYMQSIKDSVERLQKLFPRKLHSVYVYGSVARGDALQGKSDLDLLALFDGKLSQEQSTELKHLASELSHTYRFLVREVGIAIAYYDYALDPVNYYEQAFLKELCVCVHGEDLRGRFCPYKLTPEIATSFNGDICEVVKRTLSRLETATTVEFKAISQGFARKLIRTYYSMVMARSQIWSTRLHEQAEIFLHYFPDKKPIINTLQEWIEQPPMDRTTVIDSFKREGKWACENFVREAHIPS
ncbi:MAG: nucleotidyltransferase domain-containing protein [Bacillota bacterium]